DVNQRARVVASRSPSTRATNQRVVEAGPERNGLGEVGDCTGEVACFRLGVSATPVRVRILRLKQNCARGIINRPGEVVTVLPIVGTRQPCRGELWIGMDRIGVVVEGPVVILQ